ncbi:MAG: phosphoribosylformylglycinamidine cyclo-ligase [Candidatus Kapaibacterium sp.]
MGVTYKSAGVDIEAGDETVRRVKPLIRSTFNDKVLTDIGLFGGFYDGKFEDFDHPILVASTDGVGTKLKLAFATGIHNTVGNCLVNHCVNDILSCGAEPLFFLDYFATGKLSPDIAEQVITGFVNGCLENGCALIGGETAEMPSIYGEGEYDISGTIVGVVDKPRIVNGTDIREGDVMIGLESSGLHTNGYSLARAVLLEKFRADEKIDELGKTVGEAMLEIHRSYLKTVRPLLREDLVRGISHITGGGIVGNTLRVVPEGLALEIDWKAWDQPYIFKLIQETGDIADEEMRHVFNLGIGMILIVRPEDADRVMKMTASENPVIIGKIKKA